MLWWCILLTAVLFSELQVGGASVDDDNLDNRYFGQVLEDNIRRKCLKNGGNSTLALFEKGVSKYEECSSAGELPRTEEEIFTMICLQSPTCMKSLMKNIEPCLGAEEKYLLSLISSIGDHCKNGGEAFKAKMKGIEDVNCGTPPPFILYAIEVLCYPKLIFMHHKSEPDFAIPVADACSDVKTLQDCIIKLMPQTCGNDDATKYASVFLEPALHWCEDNMSTNEVE